MKTILILIIIIILIIIALLIKFLYRGIKKTMQFYKNKTITSKKKIYYTTIFILMVLLSSEISAGIIKTIFGTRKTVNVMFDKNKNLLKIEYETRNMKFTIDRGFPFNDKTRNLILTDLKTNKEIKKLIIDKDFGLVWHASQLDKNRILLNTGGNLGIWDIETNEFKKYIGLGSGSSGKGYSMTGVSHDEKNFVSFFPQYRENVILYKQGVKKDLFNNVKAISPSFSPNDLKVALFINKIERYKVMCDGILRPKHKELCYLIILDNDGNILKEIELPGNWGGDRLSWSPSGKFIAGIVGSYIYIWNSDGKELIKQIDGKNFDEILWNDEEDEILFIHIPGGNEKEVVIYKFKFDKNKYL